jgi:histone-lysine N-methyltransferase SETMAR
LYDGEEREEIERKKISSTKSMITVFISKNGLESLDILPQNQTMDSNYYLNFVIKPLIRSLKRKYRGEKIFLHFDNSRVHKKKIVTDFITDKGLNILSHPPYSPDISICDFFFLDI